jgi:two-component sensor histidine kinase
MTEIRTHQTEHVTAQASLDSELVAAGCQLTDAGGILRSVLAGSGDCIKILDLEGRLQFMSEGGKRVMEVEDFSKLKGCPWPDFWEGEGNASAMAALASARAGTTATFNGEATTAKGNLRYWDVTVSPITDALGRPQQILSISRDVTAHREALQRQKWLADELAHRVKNTFAVVLAIANQTLRGADPQREREVLNSRLIALSRAQDILTQAEFTAAPIMTVVEKSLSPYRMEHDRFQIEGPVVELPAKQALALALALHELATNAVKYGALSVDGGRVSVVWSINASGDEPRFRFSWRELGGPPVSTPKSPGFGSRLIRGVLANDFGGKVHLTYEHDGMGCELDAPLDRVSSPSEPA